MTETEMNERQVDDDESANGDLNRIVTLERRLAETITLLKSLTDAVYKLKKSVLEQAGFIKAITFEINEIVVRK
ncbi:hypothetical protein LCGC14_3002810 [marine sediment metagenome]|uniref:Uncharacterized protein n=1 Tax=marine sediment metagenome TaxID=412755 RepID=A0A0F8X0F4_9ZZZZ